MIEKEQIVIPGGIRYISEWEDYGFHMTPGPCIIDKKIPGCGFTEFYLTNPENVIITSPRIMLIKNKVEQHGDKVFYASFEDFDSKLEVGNFFPNMSEIYSSSRYSFLMSDIKTYIQSMNERGLPIKIMVTYDSFGLVKDIVTNLRMFGTFTVMVDEFQSVLHDSRFKADVELKFLKSLEGVSNVHFVSATPMLEKYVNMLDEFKNVRFFELDWITEDPTRLMRPNLSIKTMNSVTTTASKIIQKYLDGDFETYVGQDLRTVVSTEAVFYVNSVKHIIRIIKKCKLTPDQVNILCSNTLENERKIRRKLGSKFKIGSVPLKGEDHRMFTFCTRTVYLGADFYSTCARTFILSDANLESLAIDISQDLPQILGRQRLIENPWKNSATFYYKSISDFAKLTKDDFDKYVKEKVDVTNSALVWLGRISNEMKSKDQKESDTASKAFSSISYRYTLDTLNSEKTARDYIYLSTKTKTAEFNRFAYVSEIRAFDIQQIDYADRFSVMSTINSVYPIGAHAGISERFSQYLSLSTAYGKMKFLVELVKRGLKDEADGIVGQLSPADDIRIFVEELGYEGLSSNKYSIVSIKSQINNKRLNKESEMVSDIIASFEIGRKYFTKEIKETLGAIFEKHGSTRKPKANLIEEWFEVKYSFTTNPLTKKVGAGYEILSIKN